MVSQCTPHRTHVRLTRAQELSPSSQAWLFHGTSEAAAKDIAKSNFMLPQHAGLFGKGAYFAEPADASKHTGTVRR